MLCTINQTGFLFYAFRKNARPLCGREFETPSIMPCRRLHGTGGLIFHVLNRGVRRLRLFDRDSDYEAFLRVVAEGQARTAIRILAYCVMPNHFHLVAWPSEDGQLVQFMQWFQSTHGKRWHRLRGTRGTGSVYQGRFKAVPVQSDSHLLTVCRYVEQNALRAGLVGRAEDWRWSSLFQRCRNCVLVPLETWPILQPENWLDLVNQPDSAAHLDDVRRAMKRNVPFGDEFWARRTAHACGMPVGARPRGRPRRATSLDDLRFA
jgi:putative transposase